MMKTTAKMTTAVGSLQTGRARTKGGCRVSGTHIHAVLLACAHAYTSITESVDVVGPLDEAAAFPCPGRRCLPIVCTRHTRRRGQQQRAHWGEPETRRRHGTHRSAPGGGLRLVTGPAAVCGDDLPTDGADAALDWVREYDEMGSEQARVAGKRGASAKMHYHGSRRR